MKFEEIKSLQNINDMCSESSSVDGESSTFELKGSSGRVSLGREEKKLISKEICAFANTYGGIVCFHYGVKEDLQAFPIECLGALHTSLEGWLRDSLEPRLLGIEIGTIEGVFVINVPESKTKPHRTAGEEKYYYRHNTISQRMPEIMISSMYRSQGFLDCEFSVAASLSSNRGQLVVSVEISNSTNVAGSKPKLHLQLLSPTKTRLRFFDSEYTSGAMASVYSVPKEFGELKFERLGEISTNNKFAENDLYPLDKLAIQINTSPNEKLSSLKYLVVLVDCMFRESQRKTKLYVFKVLENKNELELCMLQTMNSKSTDLEYNIQSFLSRIRART